MIYVNILEKNYIFLDLTLLIKRKNQSLLIIISNNYYIYVKKLYFKNFLVLTNINVKNKIGKTGIWQFYKVIIIEAKLNTFEKVEKEEFYYNN